ncbi:MAG: ATP-dependent protease La Type I [uncultured Chloroflexi bacterium]|uniref:Lon protease n=1 Tax=uncultured Chloroflexota bacterium TaxID=166587 RepID=A0A6J4KC88_9CHLR|nr:MAG: ATP-dependent protease La Type I [uncultured Chloroflexota bacterium]
MGDTSPAGAASRKRGGQPGETPEGERNEKEQPVQGAKPPERASRRRPGRGRRDGRDLPRRLPILPLINTVVFPRMTVPLLVDAPASVAALRAAEKSGPLILLVAQREEELSVVRPEDLFELGTVAQVVQSIRVPDGGMQVVVQGLTRARITSIEVVAPAEPDGTDGTAGTNEVAAEGEAVLEAELVEAAEPADSASPVATGETPQPSAEGTEPIKPPEENAGEGGASVSAAATADLAMAEASPTAAETTERGAATPPAGHLEANLEPVTESGEKTLATEALMRTVVAQLEQLVEKSRAGQSDVLTAARNIEEPGWLADVAAFGPELTVAQRQQLLEAVEPSDRLRQVSVFLTHQLEIQDLKNKIQGEIQKGMEKTQREYYLREQLKAIHRELGEGDPQQSEIAELKQQVEAAGMPEDVLTRAMREVERLPLIPPGSPEVGVVRTYVDWLVGLPWKKESTEQIDLTRAMQALNEDHFGLEKVKDRIVEFLAVRRLSGKLRSPILCFVGPPGVGKTSLGRSIAKATERAFVRVSLGGVRDEAEIRGHRRTYVGAMPGRIIRGMRDAGVKNPVFMLDEIDKLGRDFRGDPSSALLEVLDPEQNHSFSDHYLEVAFDLSRVLFITTANLMDPIPPALRDRMEVITIPGYTEEEKVQIARRFVVPRQLEQHGISEANVKITDVGLRHLIREYTREAGVRNLERHVGHICRKVARRVAEVEPGRTLKPVAVKGAGLEAYVGLPDFEYGPEERKEEVGVSYGLAVNEYGGDVIEVEATWMPAVGGPQSQQRNEPILTGQLGDVMQESVRAALSYARAHCREYGVTPDFFERHTLHVHVPAASVPKDGPSAGITMATAIISALSGRPVRSDVAMTGEITLRGKVLAIGGVKQKSLAAHRAGVKTLLLPAQNKKDFPDIPRDVRKGIKIIWVEKVEEVLHLALEPISVAPPVPRELPEAEPTDVVGIDEVATPPIPPVPPVPPTPVQAPAWTNLAN